MENETIDYQTELAAQFAADEEKTLMQMNIKKRDSARPDMLLQRINEAIDTAPSLIGPAIQCYSTYCMLGQLSWTYKRPTQHFDHTSLVAFIDENVMRDENGEIADSRPGTMGIYEVEQADKTLLIPGVRTQKFVGADRIKQVTATYGRGAVPTKVPATYFKSKSDEWLERMSLETGPIPLVELRTTADNKRYYEVVAKPKHATYFRPMPRANQISTDFVQVIDKLQQHAANILYKMGPDVEVCQDAILDEVYDTGVKAPTFWDFAVTEAEKTIFSSGTLAGQGARYQLVQEISTLFSFNHGEYTEEQYNIYLDREQHGYPSDTVDIPEVLSIIEINRAVVEQTGFDVLTVHGRSSTGLWHPDGPQTKNDQVENVHIVEYLDHFLHLYRNVYKKYVEEQGDLPFMATKHYTDWYRDHQSFFVGVMKPKMEGVAKVKMDTTARYHFVGPFEEFDANLQGLTRNVVAMPIITALIQAVLVNTSVKAKRHFHAGDEIPIITPGKTVMPWEVEMAGFSPVNDTGHMLMQAIFDLKLKDCIINKYADNLYMGFPTDDGYAWVSTDGAKMEGTHQPYNLEDSHELFIEGFGTMPDWLRELFRVVWHNSLIEPRVFINDTTIKFPGMPSGVQGTSDINAQKMTRIWTDVRSLYSDFIGEKNPQYTHFKAGDFCQWLNTLTRSDYEPQIKHWDWKASREYMKSKGLPERDTWRELSTHLRNQFGHEDNRFKDFWHMGYVQIIAMRHHCALTSSIVNFTHEATKVSLDLLGYDAKRIQVGSFDRWILQLNGEKAMAALAYDKRKQKKGATQAEIDTYNIGRVSKYYCLLLQGFIDPSIAGSDIARALLQNAAFRTQNLYSDAYEALMNDIILDYDIEAVRRLRVTDLSNISLSQGIAFFCGTEAQKEFDEAFHTYALTHVLTPQESADYVGAQLPYNKTDAQIKIKGMERFQDTIKTMMFERPPTMAYDDELVEKASFQMSKALAQNRPLVVTSMQYQRVLSEARLQYIQKINEMCFFFDRATRGVPVTKKEFYYLGESHVSQLLLLHQCIMKVYKATSEVNLISNITQLAPHDKPLGIVFDVTHTGNTKWTDYQRHNQLLAVFVQRAALHFMMLTKGSTLVEAISEFQPTVPTTRADMLDILLQLKQTSFKALVTRPINPFRASCKSQVGSREEAHAAFIEDCKYLFSKTEGVLIGSLTPAQSKILSEASYPFRLELVQVKFGEDVVWQPVMMTWRMKRMLLAQIIQQQTGVNASLVMLNGKRHLDQVVQNSDFKFCMVSPANERQRYRGLVFSTIMDEVQSLRDDGYRAVRVFKQLVLDMYVYYGCQRMPSLLSDSDDVVRKTISTFRNKISVYTKTFIPTQEHGAELMHMYDPSFKTYDYTTTFVKGVEVKTYLHKKEFLRLSQLKNELDVLYAIVFGSTSCQDAPADLRSMLSVLYSTIGSNTNSYSYGFTQRQALVAWLRSVGVPTVMCNHLVLILERATWCNPVAGEHSAARDFRHMLRHMLAVPHANPLQVYKTLLELPVEMIVRALDNEHNQLEAFYHSLDGAKSNFESALIQALLDACSELSQGERNISYQLKFEVERSLEATRDIWSRIDQQFRVSKHASDARYQINGSKLRPWTVREWVTWLSVVTGPYLVYTPCSIVYPQLQFQSYSLQFSWLNEDPVLANMPLKDTLNDLVLYYMAVPQTPQEGYVIKNNPDGLSWPGYQEFDSRGSERIHILMGSSTASKMNCLQMSELPLENPVEFYQKQHFLFGNTWSRRIMSAGNGLCDAADTFVEATELQLALGQSPGALTNDIGVLLVCPQCQYVKQNLGMGHVCVIKKETRQNSRMKMPSKKEKARPTQMKQFTYKYHKKLEYVPENPELVADWAEAYEQSDKRLNTELYGRNSVAFMYCRDCDHTDILRSGDVERNPGPSTLLQGEDEDEKA